MCQWTFEHHWMSILSIYLFSITRWVDERQDIIEWRWVWRERTLSWKRHSRKQSPILSFFTKIVRSKKRCKELMSKKRLCLSFLWVQQSIAKYSILTAWFFHVNITSGGVSEFCFGDWWLFLVVSQFGVELSYLWNQLSPLLWSGSRISADWDGKKYIKSTHFKLYFHWKWQKPLCYNLAEIIRRGFYGIVQNIWAVPSHWFGKKWAL